MSTARVCLNGRFSRALQSTGTQTVAFQLFDTIIRHPQRDIDLTIFADPAFPGIASWANAPRVEFVPMAYHQWSPYRAQIWDQFFLGSAAKRHGCQLIHHPVSLCPRWHRGLCTVVTVHDLNFYHHPEWFSKGYRAWLMNTTVPGLRKADHLVAISDYVRNDVCHSLGIPPAQCSRIYNGTKLLIAPDSPAATAPEKPVIFVLNAWPPHKNLSRLVDAFLELRRTLPELELRIGGRPHAHFVPNAALQEKLQHPGIKILGYLSEQDLAAEYHRATAFCLPSLEEGFGLPIIEAMSQGVPVVTSTASCLPEIAGDAAILVDPLSISDMVRGLKQACTLSPTERQHRALQGKERAKSFSWDVAATQYLQLYSRLLAKRVKSSSKS